VRALATGIVGIGIDLTSCAEEGVVLCIREELFLDHEVTPIIEVIYCGSILEMGLHVGMETFVETSGEQGSQLCLRELFARDGEGGLGEAYTVEEGAEQFCGRLACKLKCAAFFHIQICT
jgi:hypothetical protein